MVWDVDFLFKLCLHLACSTWVSDCFVCFEIALRRLGAGMDDLSESSHEFTRDH